MADFTIQSSQHGVTLGFYGSFTDEDEARRVAGNVARVARVKYNSPSSYAVVPIPDGLVPKRLHPSYYEA